ncbi:MAG: Nif3-like dinuclear metal center hexameric protein [Polyangiaceae bacterium]
MKVRDLVGAMDAIAPTRLAATWDNVGLLVGDETAHVSKTLLTIDCTREVVEEARTIGCQAVVSYHPPIFTAVKSVLAGSVGYELVCAGLSLVSPHTAFDAAAGGTNDVLADALGMGERSPLRRAPSPDDAYGFGRIGEVGPAPLSAIVQRIKNGLGLAHVLLAGSLERVVSRVAVCAGSGGDLLSDAMIAGAQLFVTGEMRHHDVLRAAAGGLATVCLLHSVSERCALSVLRRRLALKLPEVDFVLSTADREPFVFA